jgi:hypothetical protein
MINDEFNFDLNDASEQRSFDIIPANTVCTVQLTVKPGGAGKNSWLTLSKDGNSEHLNCEFIVVDGPHAKRKFWGRYTVVGVNHDQAINISRATLRAMLESAKGIRPDDKSDAAKMARAIKGYEDFDQLRFVARIGVEPPKNGYNAKNVIDEVVTPEKQTWKKPEQVDRDLLGKPATATAPAQPAPANAIARPQWAG